MVSLVASRRTDAATSNGAEVTVRLGDTLDEIGRRYGVSVAALLTANPQIENPNLIRPGQVLRIPSSPSSSSPPSSSSGASGGAPLTWTVRSGDTLDGIARRHGVSLDALRAANPSVVDPRRIRPGDVIHLPGGGAASAPAPVVASPSAGGLPVVMRAMAYRGGAAIGEIDLTRIDGKLVAVRTAEAFLRMRAAALRDGVELRIVSGFRTNDQQRELYDGWVRRRPGYNLAARPGYSNHQNGVAIDLNTSGRSDAVGTGPVYQWLAQHAREFGFARIPPEHWHWEFRG